MKKFIELLENNGGMKRIIHTGILSKKMLDVPLYKESFDVILDIEMSMDKELEKAFFKFAYESAKENVFNYVCEQIERQTEKQVELDEMEKKLLEIMKEVFNK